MLILQLETVNKNLEAYYDAWDKFIKAWIVIKIKDPSCVYQWRLQVGCRVHTLAINFQTILTIINYYSVQVEKLVLLKICRLKLQ